MRPQGFNFKMSRPEREDSDRSYAMEINISGWGVGATLVIAYLFFAAVAAGFTRSSVGYLLMAIALTIAISLCSRFIYWIRERREGDRVPGADRLLRASAGLLPSDVRERYVDEWLDDLRCRRDQGRRVWPAAVWILLRSVLPLTIRSVAVSASRRITRR